MFYEYEERPNGLVKFSKSNQDNVNAKKMIIVAHGPEFQKVAKILEDSTFINHITGKPFLVSSILYRNIFKDMIVEISFPGNEKLHKKNISNIDISKENYNLIKIVSQHWMKEVL
jgi:hypothetical protein